VGEFAELESYAYQHGQSVSEWIRQTLLNEVRRCSNGSLDRHIFTELVGIQLLLINTIAPLIRGERLTAEQLDAVLRRVRSIKSRKHRSCLRSGQTMQRHHDDGRSNRTGLLRAQTFGRGSPLPPPSRSPTRSEYNYPAKVRRDMKLCWSFKQPTTEA